MGSSQPLSRGTRVALAAPVLVVAAIAPLLAVPAAGGVASGPTVREYDLGVRQLPQPLGGRFAKMPIRLWGAIGVPAGKGPFPVVIVGHGAAATGCPANPDPQTDASMWPCWDVAQRNDLGMRYLVRALAAAGFVAVVPDVNAAFTDGWGEPLETLRYGQVLDATAAELARAHRGAASFGVSLRGRLRSLPARRGGSLAWRLAGAALGAGRRRAERGRRTSWPGAVCWSRRSCSCREPTTRSSPRARAPSR